MEMRTRAKIILTGEHAVLYGVPALAAAVQGGATISRSTGRAGKGHSWRIDGRDPGEFALPPLAEALAIADEAARHAGISGTIHIRSGMPPGMGLGWSASVSWGVASLVARISGGDALNLAQRMEDAFHGGASGIDLAAVRLGGVIRFERTSNQSEIAPIASNLPGTLIVAGTAPADTKTMVAGVHARVRQSPSVYDPLFARFGAISKLAEQAILESSGPDLGAAMSGNHLLLRELGVSTRELDQLVDAALEAGALGAKLTGKGGGGCVVALVDDNRREAVRHALEAKSSFVRELRL